MFREIACPRCGGPVAQPDPHRSTTCPFCNGTVAAQEVVEIERVVQRVVVVDSGGGGGASTMRCPRCAGEFREGRVRDAVLRGCTRCAGLWIDNALVGTLRERTDTDVEAVGRDLVRVITVGMSHEQRTAELSCPVCSATMRRVEIANTINSVDVCAEHGTWFDRGEMQLFVEAFKEERAGTLTEDDMKNAGLPGAGTREGGGGFFSDAFAALGSLFTK